MAVTNANYFAMFPLQETIWAKDGTGPLAGGIVRFYSDPAFTIPKDVYEQSNQAPYSFVNIGSTLVLSGIGSFVDNSGENFIPMLYPWTIAPTDAGAPGDYQPYFIRVYSSGMILEFSVTQWPPNSFSINDVESSVGISTNQITNPQFPEVSFSGTLVTTLTGSPITVPLAPGWFITASGTGDMELTQIPILTQTPSDAAYALEVALDAGVSAVLYQRIYSSPRLFAGNIVSGYFEAASAAAVFLQMVYMPSDLLSAAVLIAADTTVGDNEYRAIQGTVALDNVVSIDGPTGYVDIQIIIPSGADVKLTSVQLLEVQAITDEPAFEQISVPLQQSLLYWYDRSPLMYKQIPSFLVGWDFPLNPCQALGSTVAAQAYGANTSYYVWDQTIVYQTQTSAVDVSRDTSGALLLTMAKTDQIAVIQYLDQTKAREILEQPMCVNVCGSSSASTKLAVSLWYTTDASLPDIKSGSRLSLVASLDANGVPATENGTWDQVPRGTLGNGYATLAPLTSAGYTSVALSGWDLGSHTTAATATYFAIVIGTPSVAIGSTISLESVSLQSGTIATRPAPQTADEVLRECEYYYEKSYESSTVAETVGAVTIIGSRVAPQTAIGSPPSAYAATFGLVYNAVKLSSSPIITLYSTASATASQAFMTILNANGSTTATVSASVWTQNALSSKSVSYVPNSIAVVVSAPGVANIPSAFVRYQYVVDSRLGVI